jgi:hypothetical protein
MRRLSRLLIRTGKEWRRREIEAENAFIRRVVELDAEDAKRRRKRR